MAKTTTSEEKLLKLIRRKKKPVHPAGDAKGRDPGPAEEHLSRGKNHIHFLDVSNVMLVLLSGGLAAYFAVNSLFFNRGKYVFLNVDSEVSSPEDGGAEIRLPEPKPFQVYERKMEQRDIFEMPWERSDAAGEAITEASADLGAQLKVVGIVLDADPKAIVEDVKTKQTFFLSQGESIAGALLEEIREDRVIFIYHNKTVEIVP